MATLFEIRKEIEDCFDFETGEILDVERLEELEIAEDEKKRNIGLLIKNLKSDAEAYKKEKEVFAEKERVCKNKVESLQNYLTLVLDGTAWESADKTVKVSFRRTQSVEVTDFTKLTGEFLKYKEPEPNKTAIKEAIKSGNVVPGAELVEKKSISVK